LSRDRDRESLLYRIRNPQGEALTGIVGEELTFTSLDAAMRYARRDAHFRQDHGEYLIYDGAEAPVGRSCLERLDGGD
jgi:hypothetical protein